MAMASSLPRAVTSTLYCEQLIIQEIKEWRIPNIPAKNATYEVIVCLVVKS